MTSVEASAEIFADSAIVQAGGPKLASPSAKSRPRHAAGPDLSPVPAVIAVETTPVKDATADVSAQSIASSIEGGSASKPKSKFPRRKKFSKSPAKKNSESADEVVNAAVVESAPVTVSAPSPTVAVPAAVSPLVSKTVSVPTAAAVVEPAVAATEPGPVPVAAPEEVPSVEAPASDTATNEPVPQAKKANHRKRQPKARKAKAAAATAPDAAAASDATAEATPAPAAADAESTSARVGSAPTRGGRPPFSNSNRPRGQPMSRPRSGMYPGNYIPNSRSYPMFNAPVFIPRNFRHRNPQRRDVFSGQMVKFQQDKRQKPEMYKNKNTLACALERTLKQAFPGYSIRLYMVGSSTNGIGDNSPLVEICIMFNKPAPPRSASRRAQSETVTTSSTSDAEQESPATVASESTSEDAPVVAKVAQSGDETVPSSADESSTETVNASQSSAASATDKSGIDLAQIATVIKNQNFGKNIQLAYCETPYLTFKDDVDNLDVKLYLNADTHIRTTQLIRDYSKLEWRFQHLAMILKAWARENGILSEETIDDLSWSLMVLHYLQVAKARVLPSLQKMVPRRYEPHQAVERLISGFRFTPNWRSSNRSFLRELLTGLFNYYGNEFNYEQYIISVREGKLLDRATHLASGESHWDSLLCIEEPYSRLNTTRTLTDKAQLESIIGLFKAAFDTLTDATGTEETPKEFALSDLITVPAAATVAVVAAPVESQ